jgi:hypothetical protein
VLATVESLRRGDRIYLPGPDDGRRARVVAEVDRSSYLPPGGEHELEEVWVSYYSGEWSRPLRDQRGRSSPRELVQQTLRPFPPGTRLRCRRLRPAGSAAIAGGAVKPRPVVAS